MQLGKCPYGGPSSDDYGIDDCAFWHISLEGVHTCNFGDSVQFLGPQDSFSKIENFIAG